MSRLTRSIAGKWHATRALAQYARDFRNWREIFKAYRSNRPLPIFKMRNGLEMHHASGDDPIHLFREIFLEECYTPEKFYKIAPTDIVLDIGANIGVFALFLQSRARGIRVHCFEPASRTRALLEENVTSNQLSSYVTIHPSAVSDHAGKVGLKQSPISGHRSLFGSQFVEDEVEYVGCITLDQAIAYSGADSIDLLKIDTEGAEIEIIEGLDPKSWVKIKRVVVEYHDLFRPGCRDRTIKVLTTANFHIEVVGSTTEGLGMIYAQR